MLSKMTTPIKLFSIEESGQYTLRIEQKGEHDIAVAKLDMALRRNVIVPNMKIVMAGGIALLLAITGFILTRKKTLNRLEHIASPRLIRNDSTRKNTWINNR